MPLVKMGMKKGQRTGYDFEGWEGIGKKRVSKANKRNRFAIQKSGGQTTKQAQEQTGQISNGSHSLFLKFFLLYYI